MWYMNELNREMFCYWGFYILVGGGDVENKLINKEIYDMTLGM